MCRAADGLIQGRKMECQNELLLFSSGSLFTLGGWSCGADYCSGCWLVCTIWMHGYCSCWLVITMTASLHCVYGPRRTRQPFLSNWPKKNLIVISLTHEKESWPWCSFTFRSGMMVLLDGVIKICMWVTLVNSVTFILFSFNEPDWLQTIAEINCFDFCA